jgi:predicted DNA-binding mobile mystery protein A
MNKSTKLSKPKRKILDQKLSQYSKISFAVPKNGWIKAIREALGMTTAQLGERMKIAASNITILENREINKKTTLETMERAAAAMGCKFVYALIPDLSLEEVVRVQAKKSAKALIQEIHHHMKLEKQKVNSEVEKEQVDELAEEILNKMDSRLWRKEK